MQIEFSHLALIRGDLDAVTTAMSRPARPERTIRHYLESASGYDTLAMPIAAACSPSSSGDASVAHRRATRPIGHVRLGGAHATVRAPFGR